MKIPTDFAVERNLRWLYLHYGVPAFFDKGIVYPHKQMKICLFS